MTAIETALNSDQIEHSTREIINRIMSLAMTRQGGFGAYFVHGYQLHEEQDARIAEHFNVDRSMGNTHVMLGDMVLQRTVLYACTDGEDVQDDAGVMTGYKYWVDHPEII